MACLNVEYDRLSNELATIEAQIAELSAADYELDGFADCVVEIGDLARRKELIEKALFICFEQMVAPIYKRKNKPRARGWWQHQLMLLR
jgi:hypothetical protein